jgi:phage terminase large subunit-like protein
MVRKRKTTSQADDLTVAGFDPYKFAGDCVYDPDAARRVCDFFETELTHVKGTLGGKPFKLEPWQRAILSNLFGWKRPDGTRRFRECFIFVPRKNGKTTMLAGIVLYMLLCDGEAGAEIYSAAADQEQAALVYQQACGMVNHNPELSSRCQIYKVSKSIVAESTASAYKAISAEAASKHGYNAHAVVVDELHAQPNRELVDVLQTSMGSRSQPLMLHITTAGFDRLSICYEKYDYAGKVRDGVIEDTSFLPVIYEAGQDADWQDESTWAAANPNLGVSIHWEFLRQECRKARDIAAYENTFRRLYLNQWTEQDVRWLSLDKWDACRQDTPDIDEFPCWGAFDLSSKIDVTSFALVWSLGGGRFAKRNWYWIPEESAHEREKRDRVPYLTWERQGWIEMTPGNVVDYAYIRAKILVLRDQYNFQQIAFDPWNAVQLATELGQDGFEMLEFRQGLASMSNPSKEFEKLIVGQQLEHDGNPVTRWMVSNVAAEIDAAGNIKPSKKKSREKIDGVVAAIMALGLAVKAVGDGGSFYDDNDIEMG